MLICPWTNFELWGALKPKLCKNLKKNAPAMFIYFYQIISIIFGNLRTCKAKFCVCLKVLNMEHWGMTPKLLLEKKVIKSCNSLSVKILSRISRYKSEHPPHNNTIRITSSSSTDSASFALESWRASVRK